MKAMKAFIIALLIIIVLMGINLLIHPELQFPQPDYCKDFNSEFNAWYDTTKPGLYKKYEFIACGDTFYYYKSKGFGIWKK